MRIDLTRIAEKVNQYFSNDIKSNARATRRLIDVLIKVANSLHDAKIEGSDWEIYFEGLIYKIVFHSTSVTHLCNGQKMGSPNSKSSSTIIDNPSVFLLTRGIIESYLTLEYIYIKNLPQEERFFRFKLWEVSGLITRQGFEAGIHKDLQEIKAEEKEIIEQLKLELINDPYFSKLTKPQKKKLETYGLPRIESWHSLIQNSKLETEFYGSVYKLLSNYAHSEFLSILQIKQANYNITNKVTLSNANLSLTIVKQIVSLISMWLTSRYKSAEIVFNSLSENDIKDIKFWGRTASTKISDS